MKYQKLYLPILVMSLLFSCSETKTADEQKEISIYSDEQIKYEDSYNKIEEEINQSKDNSVLYDQAIDKRNYLSNSLKTMNNWGGEIQEVNISGISDELLIDVICYNDHKFTLHVKNFSHDEVAKLRKGMKIRFSGTNASNWLTGGEVDGATYSIVNSQ